MARIAHLASDVIVSVVPSFEAESEFSEPLRGLYKHNAPSVVCKTQPEVCLHDLGVSDAIVLTFSPDPHSPPKCGSPSLCFPAHPRGQAHQRHHNFFHPCKVDTTPIQARPVPRRSPRIGSAIGLPRLLRYHFHPAIWIRLHPVGDTAGVAGSCSDCTCLGYQVGQGCHSLLRLRRDCFQEDC